MDQLENEKISRMGKEKKIVGGDHAQAEKFRTLINWLIQGGAKVYNYYYYSESVFNKKKKKILAHYNIYIYILYSFQNYF